MSKQGDTCGNCIFFPKFLVCKRFYKIHGKDGICPGRPKKPERRSEEQYEEWKRKNRKWLESIMKSKTSTPN